MKVIYIVGPFREPTCWDIEMNVRRAERAALEIWRLGAVALCPHMNTRSFHGALPDHIWLDGDLELMVRCDAVFCLPGWRGSAGSCAEYTLAREKGMPVLECLAAVERWLREGNHGINSPATNLRPDAAKGEA